MDHGWRGILGLIRGRLVSAQLRSSIRFDTLSELHLLHLQRDPRAWLGRCDLNRPELLAIWLRNVGLLVRGLVQ